MMGSENGLHGNDDESTRINLSVETKEEKKEETKSKNESVDATRRSRVGSSENDERSPVSNQTKNWFMSLTPQERSSSTLFVDQAFIAAFLSLSAPLSSSSASANHTALPISWGSQMVSLSEFEEKYIAAKTSHEQTPKSNNRKTTVAAIKQELPTSSPAIESDDDDVEPPNTALRIPHSLPASEIGVEILNHTAVILPSIFEWAGSPIEQKHPVLILLPSYFENNGNPSMTFNFGSMQPSIDGSDWLRQLASSCGDIVSFGDILRGRFSLAVQQSFVEAQGLISAPGCGESLDAMPAGGPALHRTLSKVFQRCNELQESISFMKDEVKSSTLGQFLRELSVQDPSEAGLEVMLRTPVPLLLTSAMDRNEFSLITLNEEAQVALVRLEDLPEDRKKSPAVVDEKEADGTLATPRLPKEGAKEGKKKKKRNKKRKVCLCSRSSNRLSNSTFKGKKTPASNVTPQSSGIAGQPEQKAEKVNVPVQPPVVEARAKTDEAVLATLPPPPSIIPLAIDTFEASSVDSSEVSVELERIGTGAKKETAKAAEGSIAIDRHEGRVVVAGPITSLNSGTSLNPDSVDKTVNENGDQDGDEWATVEVKRSNRRKTTSPRQEQATMYAETAFSASKKHQQRGVRNIVSARTKKANRKVVREVLSCIVERIVEDESQKAKPVVPSPPRAVNSWKNGPPGANVHKQSPDPPLSFAAALTGSAKPDPPVSMRDVVMGMRNSPRPPTQRGDFTTGLSNGESSKSSEVHKKPSFVKRPKTTANSADQNTAPTYQETVSAMSNTSFAQNESKASPSSLAADRKSDSSTGCTEEAPQNVERDIAQKEEPSADASPPLPTLLSPENASSATSSVASSLEAPHSRHVHHHRSVSAADSNDVGYHLLDVCDRLSCDTSRFMSRRSMALNIRRRERGALLTALQDSVSDLWPSQCHVRLYGSCATQLDLPASDIDVVVVGSGLDCPIANGPPHVGHSKSGSSESVGATASLEELSLDGSQQLGSPSVGSPSAQINAERVVRLAADLESKPWAVQVRAIPRASVPVIKVLADPSRLGQSSGSGEWMTRRQHLAAQAAAASGKGPAAKSSEDATEEGSEQDTYKQSSLLPWRGSDVMKGLLSLDITFEGIEHGGVESTEFSAAVVSQLSAEYGLHPDATPFVQVLMVVKELLAQRKLNEPYSGGLSSYALLLLLLALVREREVIRSEIERFEQQKAAMSAEDPNTFGRNGKSGIDSVPKKKGAFVVTAASKPFIPAHIKQTPNSSSKQRQNEVSAKNVTKKQKSESTWVSKSPTPEASARNPSPSSWASIAKKMDSPAEPNKVEGSVNTQTSSNGQKLSFAEAARLQKNNEVTQKVKEVPTTTSETNNTSESKEQKGSTVTPPCFPQGYNDIVEVLCSGETTAGKLLMHFLLYYGQHFDAQASAVDLRFEYPSQNGPFHYFSPYVQRRAPGSIDPVTGMLTVDPIVVYDPLYRCDRNVARRCFAWSQVRWIFAQSYSTLASAVESSKTPPATPTASPSPSAHSIGGRAKNSPPNMYSPDDNLDANDSSSSLLRCLLSF